MAMVQNQKHNSLVEDLEMALKTSSNHGADNGFNNKDENISNASQNDRIKIIPYEANITKVFMVAF